MPNSRELFDNITSRSHYDNFYAESADEYYSTLSSQIDYALRLEGEQRRESMIAIYRDIVNKNARSTLIHRGVMSWSEDMYAKYQGNTATSAVEVESMTIDLLREICKEKGSDFVVEDRMGTSYDEYMDYITSLANSVTMESVQQEFFKQGTVSSFSSAMSLLSEDLLPGANGYAYSTDFSNSTDRKIASAYALYENSWKVIKERGFFGNLLHPIDFFSSLNVISKANTLFNKFGFNKENDGPRAMELFERTADYVGEKDMEALSDMRGQIKGLEKRQKAEVENVRETTVAREKLENAKLDIEQQLGKINAILGKYGVSVEEDIAPKGMVAGLAQIPEIVVATEYDKMRQTENFSTYIKSIFYTSMMKIASGAADKGQELNVTEMIKDASDIAVIMADKYTVLYEAPELKELAQNSAFGSYGTDMVFNLVNRCLGATKYANTYDQEAIKGEIAQAMSEYKNPIIESSRVEQKEDVVEEPTGENVVEDTKDEVRMSISVDLEEKIDDEPSQPQIGETALAKEQMAK